MFPPKSKKCHRTEFTQSCFELCASEACQGRWTRIEGMNPQSGEPMDLWGCVDDHATTVLLDNTRRLHMLTASVDSMRNEITKLQLEQIARQERQHREAMAPLDAMQGLTRLEPPAPGITLLSLDAKSTEEPH